MRRPSDFYIFIGFKFFLIKNKEIIETEIYAAETKEICSIENYHLELYIILNMNLISYSKFLEYVICLKTTIFLTL